ncbi:hypothetical protein M2459_003499 [Parabacteroides sp. PF5-5]|uniref:hypothetical protein n=1 Tax=unclassified Parabacteroides TaxID=2649774 RepID=UPI00247491C8|nr:MULTISPECIES: hypothetical protein [unclassified Parabacteroides]MDH6317738.1 hypothetical protein [Parabacteroides sp. PF5-13]MDH6328923.1 hypothetical protein [Parabacteroides sp. PH5-41]MDH6336725.1 hypothetical protein [Parabacteroides sp. PF5-5]MDH6347757.1 hypothetical protein [Parabacteroides sp. PH5-46]MDH6362717.1 hypothetical protein [Parabacteroides sp. PH5-16]
MMKKCFTVLLLLLFFAGHTLAQKGDWYNDEGEHTYKGSGTKENPFLISSVSGLTFLADQVNMTPGNPYHGVYFKLTEDLDLGAHYWISIGCDAAHPFQGSFDGNGKVIRNLYINNSNSEGYPASGLFGYLGNGARIENLTIEGGKITGDASQSISYTGSLAGYMFCNAVNGEDSIIIRNCHNKNVTIIGGETEHSNTGGLIGEGYAFCDGDGSVYILIDKCSNNAEISAGTSNLSYTGGIIGKGRGHGYCDGTVSSAASFVITSCVNNGSISGGNTRGEEAVCATGGVFGYGNASGDGYGYSDGSGVFTAHLCVNNGFVKGGNAISDNALSFTGGIFGYGDGYGYGDKSSISDNINDGNGYGSGKFIITSSCNRGMIAGGKNSGKNSTIATGGVFGFASGSASGDEQGKGYGYGSFSMRNCYHAGDITADSGCLGGMGGWISTNGNGPNHTVSAIIQDCYAAGTINKNEQPSVAITGGIVGRIHKVDEAKTSPVVDHCLAVLSYMAGDPPTTYRIVGQLMHAETSSRVLSGNYAYIPEGNWVDINSIRNGSEWGSFMDLPPMDSWNKAENAWQFPRSNNVMPRLRGIPGQTNVAVPQ